jgi:hypothetical protein
LTAHNRRAARDKAKPLSTQANLRADRLKLQKSREPLAKVRAPSSMSTTTEQFTRALDSYIRWYNEKRIKMSLGARSPLEYRRSLGLLA